MRPARTSWDRPRIVHLIKLTPPVLHGTAVEKDEMRTTYPDAGPDGKTQI